MTTINEILDEEFVQLKLSRDLRLGKNVSRPAPENSLVGLAFSGGGIRSATFNLGILQALANGLDASPKNRSEKDRRISLRA